MSGRLSYANVIATVALFLAVGGGAYAATQLPKDSVTSRQIRDGSIRTDDLSRPTIKDLRGSVGPRGDRGVPGEPGAAAAPSEASSGRAFVTTASQPHSHYEPGVAKIMSLDLPAGSYTVRAIVSVESGAPDETIQCFLNVGGTDIDIRSQLFSNISLSDFVNSALVTLPSAGEVGEYCTAFDKFAVRQDTYDHTELVAVSVGSVTTQ